MVGVRENLTALEGEIVRREPDPRRSEFDTVVLKVTGAAPAEDKPDLIGADSGAEIPVAVRRELLAGAEPGTRVKLRASRTSSGDIMAEPHPSPEHFGVG